MKVGNFGLRSLLRNGVSLDLFDISTEAILVKISSESDSDGRVALGRGEDVISTGVEFALLDAKSLAYL